MAGAVTFVGRGRELATLRHELTMVGRGDDRPGRCVLIRGRRRVGKSRLVEAFLERAGAPSLFFTASGSPPDAELARLRADAEQSTLPSREVLAAGRPADWDGALRLLAAALPDATPSVVVIDEMPYLAAADASFEGTLQRAWDRHLSRKPVLLLLVGSDLAMMEALGDYDRPFHQRGREMVVGPLNPREVQTMLALPAADAFDAALITGGLPLICAEWPSGAGPWDFLDTALRDPTSPLLVSAERSLAAEFPKSTQARDVLGAIGSGERAFTAIGRASGISAAALTRSLATLTAKRVVADELPLSTRASRERRYRVADPYLRFWLRFLHPAMPEIERGRGDLTAARIRGGWQAWRGRAIEPIAREGLARLLPDGPLPAAAAVGGYWTRTNDVEIDIVGGDSAPIARRLLFVGSIKWRESAPFDRRDLAALHRHGAALRNAALPTVAVSRAGDDDSGVDAAYSPERLIEAWSD